MVEVMQAEPDLMHKVASYLGQRDLATLAQCSTAMQALVEQERKHQLFGHMQQLGVGQPFNEVWEACANEGEYSLNNKLRVIEAVVQNPPKNSPADVGWAVYPRSRPEEVHQWLLSVRKCMLLDTGQVDGISGDRGCFSVWEFLVPPQAVRAILLRPGGSAQHFKQHDTLVKLLQQCATSIRAVWQSAGRSTQFLPAPLGVEW